jgi:hypothetical protein
MRLPVIAATTATQYCHGSKRRPTPSASSIGAIHMGLLPRSTGLSQQNGRGICWGQSRMTMRHVAGQLTVEQLIVQKPGVLRADAVSTHGARQATACRSVVTHCSLCSRLLSAVSSFRSCSKGITRESRVGAAGTPAPLPIDRW